MLSILLNEMIDSFSCFEVIFFIITYFIMKKRVQLLISYTLHQIINTNFIDYLPPPKSSYIIFSAGTPKLSSIFITALLIGPGPHM